MTGPSEPLPHQDPAIRRVLRWVELSVERSLEGAVHGDYRGIYPGPGTEAGESRLYAIGDDVRLIDWNVTARTTIPHVRDPIADHELDVWLLVDLSASQHFGTARSEKREVTIALAAAFGIPATRLADRLGAVILGDPSCADGRRPRWPTVVARSVKNAPVPADRRGKDTPPQAKRDHEPVATH